MHLATTSFRELDCSWLHLTTICMHAWWEMFPELVAFLCRYFAIKHGSAIFYKHGVTGQPRQWVDSPELFERWRDGRTGMPLVDANMREMKATGVEFLILVTQNEPA